MQVADPLSIQPNRDFITQLPIIPDQIPFPILWPFKLEVFFPVLSFLVINFRFIIN